MFLVRQIWAIGKYFLVTEDSFGTMNNENNIS